MAKWSQYTVPLVVTVLIVIMVLVLEFASASDTAKLFDHHDSAKKLETIEIVNVIDSTSRRAAARRARGDGGGGGGGGMSVTSVLPIDANGNIVWAQVVLGLIGLMAVAPMAWWMYLRCCVAKRRGRKRGKKE